MTSIIDNLPEPVMAGYSGTPLAKKLGIKERFRVSLVEAPAGFESILSPIPPDVTIREEASGSLDLIVVFVTSQADIERLFLKHARRLKPDGMIWVAWPKKSSGVATDLSDQVVREFGLSKGLVDTKVCAIDDVWSGLKFVVRVQDRATWSSRQ